MFNLASFGKLKACGQTELPDMSLLKRAENCWKMPKLKNSHVTFWVIFKHCGMFQFDEFSSMEILSNFQSMWMFFKTDNTVRI